jgi:hypothetical protein
VDRIRQLTSRSEEELATQRRRLISEMEGTVGQKEGAWREVNPIRTQCHPISTPFNDPMPTPFNPPSTPFQAIRIQEETITHQRAASAEHVDTLKREHGRELDEARERHRRELEELRAQVRFQCDFNAF